MDNHKSTFGMVFLACDISLLLYRVSKYFSSFGLTILLGESREGWRAIMMVDG